MAPVHLLVVVASSAAAWVDVPAGSRVQVVQALSGCVSWGSFSFLLVHDAFLRQIEPSVCFLGYGVKQRRLIKIVLRMGVVTAYLFNRVQAEPNCPDDISLQLSSLREKRARLLEAFVAGEEIAGHDAVRMLVGYHDKLAMVLAVYGGAGSHDVDEGPAVPVVVPPGGQIDTRLLDLLCIGTDELPTNWIDRSLVAQLTCSLARAMEAVKNFVGTTEKGSPLEEADAEGREDVTTRKTTGAKLHHHCRQIERRSSDDRLQRNGRKGARALGQTWNGLIFQSLSCPYEINGRRLMGACCYYQPLRPPPCPSVPRGQKPQKQPLFRSRSSSHQSLHVASKAAGLTTTSSRSKDARLRAILHEDSVTGVRPWFSLFGMSFSDLYDHFPESVWDICEDSPAEALEKKEHKAWMQFRSEMSRRYNKAIDISFDDRFADSIVFDKMLYKYAILGCKVNADGIMNQGVISASERNKIIHALERIEDDIEIGKFKWRDGADVHTSIVEALADMIGDRAKDLAVESKYDSCLMILETWSKNSIHHIMTQLKQLQVALVLLAIKNDGVILGEREIEGTTCLESLLLRIVKVLDYDASELRSSHESISCSNDGVMLLRISYPENHTFSKLSSMASFAESINNCIPNHLRQLLEKVLSRRNILLLTPNGETTIYDTVLAKFGSIEQTRHHGDVAISKCLNIGFGNGRESPQTCEIEDAKHYLFSSTKSVVEILDLSIQLVQRILFGMEKAQNSLPRGYHDVMRFTHFLTTKGIDSGTAYALAHLCLDKKLQPSELTLDKHELKQIDFHCERAHYLLQYKGSIFGDSTDLDACKKMLKWCCKLRIDPAATICS
uniref:Uncharacterized protein n=1 Tax=Oryza punctata TaxID=4537 RepID=A0A0E0KKX4_ORYPU